MAPITISEGDGDWLASLARQSASTDVNEKAKNNSKHKRKRKGKGSASTSRTDNKNSQGDDGDATAASPLTKAERIQRRGQKRIEREERRRMAAEARQHRLEKKRQKSKRPGSGSMAAAATPSPKGTNHHGREKSERLAVMSTSSKRSLAQLSTNLKSTASSRLPQSTIPRSKRNKSKQQQREEIATTNGVPAIEPKGKATKRSALRPDSKELQPRKRDYNGQGLVRPTLFLPLDDPSFVPKLELEFGEHVPGFFGRAKTKAAKKQSDENMLWKRCLKAKEEEGMADGKGGGVKRKKKGAKPDERVEGMMRTGIM